MQAHHCEQLTKTYFAELKTSWVDQMKISPDDDLHDLRFQAEDDYQKLSDAVLRGTSHSKDEATLNRLLQQMGLPATNPSLPDYPLLVTQLRQAEKEAQRIVFAKLSNAPLDQQTPSGPFAMGFSMAPPLRFQPPATAPKTMRDMVTWYCAEKMREGRWRDGKVRTGNERKLLLFAQTAGLDKAPHDVTYDDIQRYRDLVWELPQNFRKGKDNYGETLEQAVMRKRRGDLSSVSNKTIQQHFIAVQAMFKSSRKLRHIPEDLTEGLLDIGVRGDDTKRRASMTPEHTQTLLNSDAFTNAMRGDKWVTLFGHYTGAREGEIVNLCVNEIKQEGGICYIALPYVRDGRKVAKTPQSKRLVPIHPDLMKAGFGEYLSEMKKRQEAFLFPDVVYEKVPSTHRKKRQDPTDAFGKRFRGVLSRAGLRDDGVVDEDLHKLCFYSLRHGFKDATINADIEERYAKALMGHKDNSVHGGYGSRGYPIEKLAAAMEKIDFGLSLPKIR